MKTRLTPIAAAAALTLSGALLPAFAQQAAPAAAPAKADAPEVVVVKGIRSSLQSSLKQKREADTNVEVITAEDIGKMPDKNIADSLQRVPGVTISSAGATEGGFDENDRVSMRGTNPSLTLTLINGHPVSSGDWFVLNQSDNAGRSVSYTLLPSELVSRVVVNKSSQASLVEGGVAGTVDIITRKPLEFSKQLTLEASLGAVYATLPKKTDPQLSALLNFKNEGGTVGALVQVFSQKRHLRRDGVEVLGYDRIAPGSTIATASPDLSGVYYPRAIGAALFEQERERTGGLINVQVKPTKDFSLDLSAFSSVMKAANYNRNYLLFSPRILNGGAGQAPEPGYVVRNNTLVSARFAPVAGTSTGLYDQISRPDEAAESKFVAAEATWRVNNNLSLNAKAGSSTGVGKTPTQDVAEWAVGRGTGASWQLNGADVAPSFSLNEAANRPGTLALDWIFGFQNLVIKDKDEWAQVDAEYAVDKGVLSTLKFGARVARHTRSADGVLAQGPRFGPGASDAFNPANWPSTFSNYPGNFASGLGGTFPRDVWYFTAEQMAAANAAVANRDPTTRRFRDAEFGLKEDASAAYVQANLEGKGWKGDVGLRVVQTKEHVLKYLSVPATAPGAIVGSAFSAYLPNTVDNTYTDVLPSFNLKVDLSKDLVTRFAVSKTMTRPDYSALAGTLNLSPPATQADVGGGSASNPNLKPVRSTNVDAVLQWYHAPRSLLSAGLFYMNLSSYIGQGQVRQQYLTFTSFAPNGYQADYLLTTPVNSKGSIKGIELAVEQPLGKNFGVSANYTYADAKEKGGGDLVGASRNTYNVVGYYEDDRFNARLAYNFRSHFYSGLDRSTAFNQADTGNLAASIGFKINEHLSLSLDGHNLNNPKLRYYALNEDQPRSIYQNGRQYYLTLRAKL